MTGKRAWIHSFTKGFVRPFDHVLMTAMQKTMMDLCKNIQGAVFGYTQSDEISLLLIDYLNLDSSAWFDNEVQKSCSVSASMCTLYFNQHFSEEVAQAADGNGEHKARLKAAKAGGMFDARCFNVPRDEVTNYFLGRQNDATRNSIQMVGQCYFKHRELQGKSGNEIQDMLLTKYDVNWNHFYRPGKTGRSML
ncbi:MAG: tRNA(His) guanylyltransferase Thg1 family protein [Clostridia bacterium]|nr:tRNA(His) guanylyltransferase Thg1 family protein [Clostridia bacterium]